MEIDLLMHAPDVTDAPMSYRLRLQDPPAVPRTGDRYVTVERHHIEGLGELRFGIFLGQEVEQVRWAVDLQQVHVKLAPLKRWSVQLHGALTASGWTPNWPAKESA